MLFRLLYALTLALVFPFICWGGAGDAGHEHLEAHFVFAPPAQAQPAPEAVAGHGHAPGAGHTNAAPGSHAVSGRSGATADGTFAASPDTLVLFTLLLVAISSGVRLFQAFLHRLSRWLPLGAPQRIAQPPIPPPQTV